MLILLHNKKMTTTTYTITPEQRNTLLSKDGREIGRDFQSMKQTYDEQGFVLVRGLIDPQLLARVCDAGEALVAASSFAANTFNSLDFGAIFNFQDDAACNVNGDSFRETALGGAIPAFVAKVLLDVDCQAGKEGDTGTLRLLKDAFMAKGKEQNHCGWHVDDISFWPTDSSSTGVNVWLSLDDIPSKYGGGMAISPKSHLVETPWRERAYATIGSTPLLPVEGLKMEALSVKSMQTCFMSTMDPELNKIIESTKLEFDYKPGDCLFCHRWLFHRSVEINEAGMSHYGDDLSLKRYTVRYEKGRARLLRGICLEPAILMDSGNSGKTLDDVSREVPYYPQCWPPLGENNGQVCKMKALAQDILPSFKEKKAKVMKEILDMMKKGAAYG